MAPQCSLCGLLEVVGLAMQCIELTKRYRIQIKNVECMQGEFGGGLAWMFTAFRQL